MRILHINFTAPFSPAFMYKENYLIRAFQENGDKVLVLSTLEEYRENRVYINTPGRCCLDKNVCIWRIPFRKVINGFFTQKIRRIDGFVDICKRFSPDIIIMNEIQFYNVLELKEVKGILPRAKIYGNVSAAAYNSATNWPSYYLLHKGIYRSWLKRVYKYFDKIFYVSDESRSFLEQMYQAPSRLLEEQGLCCEVLALEEKKRLGEEFRKEHHLLKEHIIFTHTGKMDRLKNTIPLLKEFMKTGNRDFRLVLAGVFDEEIREEAVKLMGCDSRILFLGFLKYEELKKLLSATDLYLQPGSPSQTLQTAIGCLCPVVVKRMKIYEDLLEGQGLFLSSPQHLKLIFDKVGSEKQFLERQTKKMEKIAEKINYKKVASRFYEDVVITK